MARLVGFVPVIGSPTDVHTAVRNKLGTRAWDEEGREYKYMTGVASTIAGSVVTYDEAFLSTLLVTNAIGPVAVAQAAILATQFWWYMVDGSCLADVAANTADNSRLGFETASGRVGDGRAAGDEIYNFFARAATGGAAALSLVEFHNPFVDDVNGA